MVVFHWYHPDTSRNRLLTTRIDWNARIELLSWLIIQPVINKKEICENWASRLR